MQRETRERMKKKRRQIRGFFFSESERNAELFSFPPIECDQNEFSIKREPIDSEASVMVKLGSKIYATEISKKKMLACATTPRIFHVSLFRKQHRLYI